MALPMGCSISCLAFEKCSTFLECTFKKRVVCYLDGFLLAGRPQFLRLWDRTETFQGLAEELDGPSGKRKDRGTSYLAVLSG